MMDGKYFPFSERLEEINAERRQVRATAQRENRMASARMTEQLEQQQATIQADLDAALRRLAIKEDQLRAEYTAWKTEHIANPNN